MINIHYDLVNNNFCENKAKFYFMILDRVPPSATMRTRCGFMGASARRPRAPFPTCGPFVQSEKVGASTGWLAATNRES